MRQKNFMTNCNYFSTNKILINEINITKYQNEYVWPVVNWKKILINLCVSNYTVKF